MSSSSAPGASTPFDTRQFRNACGQFATGVTVMTVRDGAGVRGMTANSFTSVSLEPPLVLVSIDKRNISYGLVEKERRYVVNVLRADHQVWSDRFAGRGEDLQHQFEDVPHRLTSDGIPIIEGSLAVFICDVVAIHDAGDHSLFIGQVQQFESEPSDPLLFFGGAYRHLRA